MNLVIEDLLFPLRDGVEVAATVYRPAAGGRIPAVLERTPYGRRTSRASDQSASATSIPLPDDIGGHFAARGLAYVRWGWPRIPDTDQAGSA